MKCKVLKLGVSQRGEDGKNKRFKVGDTIEVSEAAAAHLIPEGYIEEIEAPKKKAKGKD
jgi:hypothetical protein